jgi:hypothetical protein
MYLTLQEGRVRVLDGVNDDELERQFTMLEIHKLPGMQHEQNSTSQHHYRTVIAGRHTAFASAKFARILTTNPSF